MSRIFPGDFLYVLSSVSVGFERLPIAITSK